MKNAIIIHGYPDKEEYFNPNGPSSSNRHWLPWVQNQLVINGILAQTPEMPNAWQPRYEKWKEVLECFPITEETILIGFSCGGGFLVRWLSETKRKVGKVILVAPWIDPAHEEIENITNFFNFEIDTALVSRTDGCTVLYSIDDDESVLTSVEILKAKLHGAVFKEFADKGHFTLDDMGTVEFPELLDLLV